MPAYWQTDQLTIIVKIRSITRQRRTPFARWGRKPRFHEHLLHIVLPLVELLIHLIQVLDADSVRHHLQRVELPGLDLLQQAFPVLMRRGLPVANESDPTFHERADVEVVGLRIARE